MCSVLIRSARSKEEGRYLEIGTHDVAQSVLRLQNTEFGKTACMVAAYMMSTCNGDCELFTRFVCLAGGP